MPKRTWPLKETLAWVALIIFLLYLLLMLTGVLKSPVIADIIGVGSLGYFLGIQVQKLNYVVKGLAEVKQQLKEHSQNKEAHK